jgi:SPP1 family predicted phage head-tail adaptor
MHWKITVERFSTSVNEAGTPVMTWAAVSTLRAQKIERSTREYVRAQGAEDETIIVFRVRHTTDITNADRLQFEGRTLNIRELVEIGRRVGLELRCTQHTGIPE